MSLLYVCAGSRALCGDHALFGRVEHSPFGSPWRAGSSARVFVGPVAPRPRCRSRPAARSYTPFHLARDDAPPSRRSCRFVTPLHTSIVIRQGERGMKPGREYISSVAMPRGTHCSIGVMNDSWWGSRGSRGVHRRAGVAGRRRAPVPGPRAAVPRRTTRRDRARPRAPPDGGDWRGFIPISCHAVKVSIDGPVAKRRRGPRIRHRQRIRDVAAATMEVQDR